MRDLAASEKLIEELLSLVDDGTITEDERTIVTQAIQANAAVDEANIGLIEQLQAAMQASLLPGNNRPPTKLLCKRSLSSCKFAASRPQHLCHGSRCGSTRAERGW